MMQPIFEVRNLKRAFGGLAVTNDVSLSMAPGDRVALIGPNGAGKTTFVNLVTGNLALIPARFALAARRSPVSMPSEGCREGWCAPSRSPACFSI